MDKLFQCLSKLCQNNTYAELISIYFTAKMILAFSDDNNYTVTINTSAGLKKALYTYSSSISPLLDENHLEEWTEFCEYMNKTKLADNFRNYLSIVTPAVVSDWTPFLRVFNANDTGKILVALILILRAAPPDNLIISKDWKKQKYLTYEKDFKRIGLDFESYDACWHAVYLSDLASSDHMPSRKVVAAKKLYHSMQLPMTDLLDDYSTIYLKENEFDQKVATRGGRTTSQKKPLPESGKTEKDQELQEVLQELSGANPIDVVRGLFYSSQRNDAGFECTFLMRRFRAIVSPDDNVAVVNPSPDMVLQLMQNKILCKNLWFFVADETVAKLYAKQFRCDIFCPMYCLSETGLCFDKILITVRDSAPAPLFVGLQHASSRAQTMILAPETSLRQLYTQLKETGMNICMAISVPNSATQSSPRKKVLVEASIWWSINDRFILQRGFCDEAKTLYSIEKISRLAPCQWVESNMTIADMRKLIDQKPATRKNSDPIAVRYSPEITMQLTLQTDRGGKCAGRAYYRRILRPEDKHRMRGDRLTPVVEKGLRHNTVEEVVAAVETVVLDERLAPAIVDDVLDAYAGRIHELSFKTGWFCIRWRLLTKYGYKEELVLELFARGDDLALISIGTNNPLVYENAMENLFKGDVAVPRKYWEQLVLILATAKEAEFIEQNPLSNHMITIANRMTKRQQEVRNALTKKTFEIGEEKILLNDMFAQEQGYATWMETNPSYIALPIAAMATPDYREVAALRWMDMVQIGKLDSYQFQITQYIASNGALRPVFDRKPELRRCVPLAAPLARLLLAYKEYLKKKYNLSDEQLALVPMVLFDHSVLKRAGSRKMYSDPTAISRLIKCNIDSLGIQPFEIMLPGEIEDKDSDLNTYSGNILRSNLRYRLRHLCRFTEGELCYYLGQKAPDTFSAHYCAYDHPALQQRMVCKLNRWMGVLAPSDEDGRIINHKEKVIFGEETLVLSADGYGAVHADVSIMPEEGSTMESMSVKISSDHGVTGTIITMNRNKEDEYGNK